MNVYPENRLTDLEEAHLEQIIHEQEIPELSEERMSRMKQRVFEQAVTKKPKRKKRVGLLIAVAVFACVVFMGAVNINRIQQFWQEVTFDFDKVAASLTDTATDQGYKMKIKDTVAIQDGAYMILEFKDISGKNRLTENGYVTAWDIVGKDDGNRDVVGQGMTLESFDKETGTAAFSLFIGDREPGERVIFSIFGITPDAEDVNADLNDIDLAKLLKENPGKFVKFNQDSRGGGITPEAAKAGIDIDTIKNHLKPDQMKVPLSGKARGYISNIAYRNGCLYVQYCPQWKTSNDHAFLNLKNKQTGKVVEYYYNYGIGDQYLENEDTNLFKYEDYVFQIPEKELGDYILNLEASYPTQEDLGKWSITTTIPEVIAKEAKNPETEIPIGDTTVKVEKLRIASMDCYFQFSRPVAEEDLAVNLVYEDGSVVSISDRVSAYQTEEPAKPDKEYYVGEGGSIENVERIAAVEINGVQIPVQ